MIGARSAPVRIFCWFLAMLTLAVQAKAADPLVADLSSREIAITTGFTGSELLLFGAVDGDGDVVVVVRGPLHQEVVRRKERMAGIWINAKSVSFREVPSFYHVASTRPLTDIASSRTLTGMELGADRLKFQRVGAAAPDDDEFKSALLRNKQRDKLYTKGYGNIKMMGRRLFRTTVIFPTIVPTGAYSVDVLLFRGGRVVDSETTALNVHKVGLEADIFNFAHQQSALYGVIAILIALMAGWLAGAMFRQR
jgi:uncharacterized protein (TIGR02186 family)